jgi:hypothetical protein
VVCIIQAIIALAPALIAYATIRPAVMNGHIGSAVGACVSSCSREQGSGCRAHLAGKLLWHEPHFESNWRRDRGCGLVRCNVAGKIELFKLPMLRWASSVHKKR